jgi:hypothetical protein
MRKPIKLFSGLIHIVTGIVTALIVLFSQNWFGDGDIWSYLFWTIPLAIGISVIGNNLLGLIPTENKLLRVVGIAIISGIFSYAWVWVLYLIIGPWINAFSIPIFYLWAIGMLFQLLYLDWKLPKDEKRKSIKKNLTRLLLFPLITFGSIVAIFGFSYLQSYLTKPKAETYLIPKNFSGQFKIVYGEECGIMPKTENDRRILEVPQNGVLIIKPEFKAGIIDHEYYLVDSNGNRKKIEQYENYVTGVKNVPGVRLGGSGNYAGKTETGFSSDSPFTIRYTDFEVYKDTITGFEYTDRIKMDSLTRKLVEECRNGK